jgi:hypothetical protein
MSDSNARPGDGVEQSSSELRCEADYDDWVDIAESEFVDYVEGRR